MRDNQDLSTNDTQLTDKQDDEKTDFHHKKHGYHGHCCDHQEHFGPLGMQGHHGEHHGGHHRGEVPPHILREMMEMKEKIGKLEGMLEVLMKKI